MAVNVTVSFEKDNLEDVLPASETVNFSLQQGGNLSGRVVMYPINTPTALNFTSDFEQSSQSATFDGTKFTKVWMIFDKDKGKVIYTLENLIAI